MNLRFGSFFVAGLVCFMILPLALFSQEMPGETGSKKSDWLWPLRIVNGFSSNFGEYRSTHFHAGIDLRTFQKNGFPVHAAADGVVEVIRKDRRGTGLGIVIRHDNGYRSFTYHLDSLRDDLQAILDAHVARTANRYPGNIELKEIIRLKAGEQYAFSGESGSGFPHLHFELRDGTGTAVNPLLYLKSPLADEKAPVLSKLVIRARDTTLVNHTNREWQSTFWAGPDGFWRPSEGLVLDGPSDWLLIAEDYSDTGRPVAPLTLGFGLDGRDLIRLSFRELTRDHNRQLGLVYDRQHTAMGHYAFNLFTEPQNTLHEIDSAAFGAVWDNLPPGPHEARVQMGDAGGNVTMARIPFYYLPHDTLVLKADATGEAWELSGDPSILPFVLRIRSFDRAGKTLTTAERSVPTWGQSARFSLRNAPTAAEGYVFEVLKDGMTVWTRFIGLSEAIPPKTKIPPVWFFNRDKIALFFADAAPLEAGIVVKGQGIRPLMNRLLPGGLYQIYAPLESGLIRLDGEAWSQAPAYLIRLNPGTESQWAANGYKMEFSSQSVNVPRVLRIQTGIEFRHDEGYPLCSVPISLDPAHLPLLEAVRVSLHLPPQVNPGQLGFFVRRGRSWSHLGTRIDGDSTFSSRIGLLGTDLALLRDIFPPRIGSGSMARMRGKRMFLVGVGDKGKGINHTQVTVFSGERRLEVEYDPDRNRLEVDLETLRPGPHRLIVGVADYAGHRTSRTFDIRIGPDDQDKGQNTETSE